MNSPYHGATSNPGTPDSATVGISGARIDRIREVTASARNTPDCTSGSTPGRLLNNASIRPRGQTEKPSAGKLHVALPERLCRQGITLVHELREAQRAPTLLAQCRLLVD